MPTKAQKAEQLEAIERLRQWVKPGDTIYCILRHVSKSGMSRVIDLKTISCGHGESEGEAGLWHIGYNVAQALAMPYDRKNEGIRIGGCGMDMGFAIVSDLAATLFPSHPCQGERCQSSEHQRSQNRVECPACEGKGFLPVADGEGNPETKCVKCRGYGSTVEYGAEPPRGAGVIHKDGGYALRHQWI